MFEDEYARRLRRRRRAWSSRPVFHAQRLGPEDQIDRDALVRRFAAAGKPAFAPADDRRDPRQSSAREARAGDVLLLMSSGAFGGLPETLLGAL